MRVLTRLCANNQGLDSGRDKCYLFFPTRPDRFCEPPSLLFNWYGGSFPGVKRPGREVDHSLPFSVEVEIVWRWTCNSTPSVCRNGDNRRNFFTLHVTKPAEGRCCLAIDNLHLTNTV